MSTVLELFKTGVLTSDQITPFKWSFQHDAPKPGMEYWWPEIVRIGEDSLDEAVGFMVFRTYWGEDAGSGWERSNYRRLREDYFVFFSVGWNTDDGFALGLPADLDLDPEETDLVDVLLGLEDYPIYDDEDLSKLNEEMLQEALEEYEWLHLDLMHDLREANAADVGDLTYDTFMGRVRTFYETESPDIWAEDATTIMFPNDRFVQWYIGIYGVKETDA